MARTTRGLIFALLLAIGATALQVPFQDAAMATTVSGGECVNSVDSSIPAAGGKRCVAGKMRSTRSRIRAACLVAPHPTPYERGECGGTGRAVELIAQARALQTLNKLDPLRSAGGISPNIQWEVQVGARRRADIVVYDSTSSTDPAVRVIEVKNKWNRIGDGAEQAESYVDGLIVDSSLSDGDVAVAGASDLIPLAGDQFSVWTPRMCPDGGRRIYEVFQTYVETDGVLGVEKVRESDCDSDNPTGEKTNEEEEPSKHDIPKFPWFVPPAPPGSDDNNDGEEPRFDPNPAPLPTNAPVPAGCGWFICIGPDEIVIAVAVAGTFLVELSALGLDYVKIGTQASLKALHDLLNKNLPVSIFGDPHLVTLDGVGYDLQAHGEFDVLSVPAFDFAVQARFEPVGTSNKVSSLSALVARVSGVDLQLSRTGVLLDGDPVTIPDGGYLYLGDGAAALRSGHNYLVFAAGNGPRPIISFQRQTGQLRAFVPSGTHTTGLLGDNDGKKNDEFKLRDGTQLSASPTPEAFHTVYANSWRVSGSSSNFTYASGESTETFTDTTFPANLVSAANYPADDQLEAEGRCRAEGVAEGGALRSCVLDLLALDDETYLQDAVEVAAPIASPDDGYLDDGELLVDFEGAVPRNFNYPRIGSDPFISSFAGPVKDSETYAFMLTDLDPHTSVDISFDLVVIGDWSRPTDTQQARFKIGDQTVWQATIHGDSITEAPTGDSLPAVIASGTLASGKPYWVYRIETSIAHHTTSLEARLVATDGTGTTRHEFGVDDIRVTADVVPPDEFAVDPVGHPVQVSNNVPGPGAGNIEGPVSKDVYVFDVPTGGSDIAMQSHTCIGTTGYTHQQWLLYDDSRKVVAAGTCAAHPGLHLSGGTYRLQVSASSGKTGTYSFDLFEVPEPQTFALSPAVGSPATVSPELPAAGAGNLETSASVDRYSFSVPAGGASIFLDNESCIGTTGFAYSTWKLIGPAGAAPISGSCSSDQQFDRLPAGSYTLEFSTKQTGGTYSFMLHIVDAPQIYSLLVGSTPTIVSDGVPSTGAGRLESRFARDRYEFSITTNGTSIVVDNTSCISTTGFTYQRWALIDSDGKAIDQGSCNTDPQFQGLNAGDYVLEVSALYGKTGPYSFSLAEVPPPETFELSPAWSAPAQVANGMPSSGAGNLETTASRDIYTFEVPEGGRTVFLDNTACIGITGFAYSHWELRGSGGLVIKSGSCSADSNIKDLPEGTYELTISTTHTGGTYAFDLYFVDDPQVFDLGPIGSPVSVVDGSPTNGAGRLETRFSRDVYSFDVLAGQSLVLDNKTCIATTGYTYQQWKLLDHGGTVAASGSCNADQVFNELSEGEYRLEISASSGKTGTYSFDLFELPEPQSFELDPLVGAPAAVSNGVPSPGAGNLETTASRDKYTFTVPTGGASMLLDNKSCIGTTGIAYSKWKLVGPPGTTTVTGSCSSDKQFNDLSAGDYTLEFTTTQTGGTYSFDLYVIDPPQIFDVMLSASKLAVSDGIPSTGAGNLETRFSADQYRFTISGGSQDIRLDNKSCISAPGYTYQAWKLIDSTGAVVFSGSCNTDKTFFGLTGDYTLSVTASSGRTGTYAFDLWMDGP